MLLLVDITILLAKERNKTDGKRHYVKDEDGIKVVEKWERRLKRKRKSGKKEA